MGQIEQSGGAAKIAPRLLIAMPFAEGSGLAWNYIERVAEDLIKRTARPSENFIAYPEIAPREREGSVVRRKFYGIGVSETIANARWLKSRGITHLYFAEYGAFDWRFVYYRLLANVRIAVHYHHAGGRSRPFRGVARLARIVRRSIGLLEADQVICVSEFLRRRVIEIAHVSAARCTAILNAVLPEGFLSEQQRRDLRHEVRKRMHITDDVVVVVCGARADLEKGIDILFEAFVGMCASMHAAGMPLPLLLYAGDGPHLQLLMEKHASLSHGDCIRMLGRVSPMRDLLAASDVAVLPSVCDEAFGLFAIESMQAGLPIVVTDRGGLIECVTDGSDGFVVPARSVRALETRLSELVQDPVLRAKMSEQGQARVRVRNSYDRMISALFARVTGAAAE